MAGEPVSRPLYPAEGWVPGNRLGTVVEFRTRTGFLRRYELQWPATVPLPAPGEHLALRGWYGPPRDRIVRATRWETQPGHGSIQHPMLSVLVLVLGDVTNGDELDRWAAQDPDRAGDWVQHGE